jgi:hypothetical protein
MVICEQKVGLFSRIDYHFTSKYPPHIVQPAYLLTTYAQWVLAGWLGFIRVKPIIVS